MKEVSPEAFKASGMVSILLHEAGSGCAHRSWSASRRRMGLAPGARVGRGPAIDIVFFFQTRKSTSKS